MSYPEDSSSFCSLQTRTSNYVSQGGGTHQTVFESPSESTANVLSVNSPLSKTNGVKDFSCAKEQSFYPSTYRDFFSLDSPAPHVDGKKPLLKEELLRDGKNALSCLNVEDFSKKLCILKSHVCSDDGDDDSASSISFAVCNTNSDGINLSRSGSFVFTRDSCQANLPDVAVSPKLVSNEKHSLKNGMQRNVTQPFTKSDTPGKVFDNNTYENGGDQNSLDGRSKHMTQPSHCDVQREEVTKSADNLPGDCYTDRQKNNFKGQRGKLLEKVELLPRNSPRGGRVFSKIASAAQKNNNRNGKKELSCSARSRDSSANMGTVSKRHGSAASSLRSNNSECSLLRDRKFATSRKNALAFNSFSGRSVTPRTGSNCSASSRLRCTTPEKNKTLNSMALLHYKQFCLRDVSGPKREEQKEALLALLEDEMDVLQTDLRERDAAMELRMLQSPFERLYHMNNRRDRDERRSRIFLYMKLAEAREHLMDENVEEEEHRRALRKEVEQEREKVFARLYNSTPRRQNNDCSGSEHSTRNKLTVTNDAFFDRLYKEAVSITAAKRERMRQAQITREREEMENALRTRILAKMELDASPRRVLTPREKEERAKSLQQKLINDPQRLQAYLQTQRLSKKKEEELASRLTKCGLTSAEQLANKKLEKELEGCTFHPNTNRSRGKRRVFSVENFTRPTLLSATRSKKGDSQAVLESPSPRKSLRVQKQACEKLYMKAVSQRQKAKLHAAEVDRQKRLDLLKSRLKEDHHFRRRVELNPSLAERYMASLVV